MNCAVIVVGAGRGTRHGGEIPKQYQNVGGMPVFRRTLMAFLDHALINTVIAVIADDAAPFFAVAADGLAVRTVIGGASRTASVQNGLKALAGDAPDLVLIHDAARPFVRQNLISQLIAVTGKTQGAAPGLTPADALKRLDGGTQAGDDIPRDGLVMVQTPQVFDYKALCAAYAGLPDDADLADDLAIARAGGISCTIIDGDPDNFKITRSGDLQRGERLVRGDKTMLSVTGTGFDVHKIIAGTQMMLCGVPIKGELALLGHSDADAALHALTDAILGTIGAGDIGDHFPPDEAQWRNTDSSVFLQKALELIATHDARLVHVDLTIIAERPKIKPHRAAMILRLSELLGLEPSRISVKATTTEGLGFTGRGEGLAVLATASVALPMR